jgi:hypothetical protein
MSSVGLRGRGWRWRIIMDGKGGRMGLHFEALGLEIGVCRGIENYRAYM